MRPEDEITVIMEGAKPEIDEAISRINWELFGAYMQARNPHFRPTTKLAKRKDIARVKCKRNIPCPMGGMECCITCDYKDCKERCSKQATCIIKMVTPTYKQIGLIALIICAILLAILEVAK